MLYLHWLLVGTPRIALFFQVIAMLIKGQYCKGGFQLGDLVVLLLRVSDCFGKIREWRIVYVKKNGLQTVGLFNKELGKSLLKKKGKRIASRIGL